MSNTELWDRVSKTNPEHTKKVNFGRPITAIDPYRQIENATREFGPAGKGWGWSVSKVEYIEAINELGVLVRLWHGDQEKSIEQWGQAGLYIDKAEKKKDTDLLKKATTDGITKCLSYLGFNADVFLGKFDDNKYVQERQAEETNRQALEWHMQQNQTSIEEIKRGLEAEEISTAAEAWVELSKEAKQGLWVAHSKGGPFTASERKTIQSKEFREAYYGADE